LHYSVWSKLAIPAFLLSLAALAAVLIPGIGVKVGGARRWISLFGNSVQPSEIVKLTLAVYLAKLSSAEKSVLAYFLPFAAVCALIMLEPDLGTTLVVVAIGMSGIFVSGVNLLYFAGAGILGVAAAVVFTLASSYRRARFLTFLAATSDPLGRDYHMRQVLFALGSGGLFGVGLGQSRQKYLFLPQAATDSIFAIVAEEVGFIGAVILVILFFLLIYKGFAIAKSAPDKFSATLAVGITIWLGAQIILNIGSMVSLVPLTGVPLPLFSYGGTALVMELLGLGILLNISRYAKAER
jgi:cell division protein FtsW